jgi:hypothetical protein
MPCWKSTACKLVHVRDIIQEDLTTDIRQTQTINPDLLSTLPDAIFPLARKADLALAFNPYHPLVQPAFDSIHHQYPGISLSQMSDAYTSALVFGCGIEIKESGGDYNEAIMQLGVWSAAGLEKMWSMIDMEKAQSMMPLLGITAIGHEWKIHISWKVQGTGETVSPIPKQQIAY